MARKAPRTAGHKSAVDKDRPLSVPTSAKKPRESIASMLGRFRWDWLAAALSVVVLAWLVTQGDWNFFPKAEFLESFYDGQAQSLLHGRIDVPPDAIGPEAFMRDGKAYGYFGPTPALIRLPLQLLLPGMYGRWGRLSMLLASMLTLGMLLLLLRQLDWRLPQAGGQFLRNLLRAALIFAVAIGSTNLFVSTEHKMYQESIIWGSALAFAQAVFLATYLMSPKGKWLALSCGAALLAFLSRVSSGAGPLFSLLLLDAILLVPATRFRAFFTRSILPRRAAVAVTATLVASAVLWAGLNYWKFGIVFTSQPIALNRQFDQQRLQRAKGSLFSLYNLPVTVAMYFSPVNIAFTRNFPWAFLTMGDASLASHFPKAHFDTFEPFASLPAGMPELLLAAIGGTVLCLGRRRPELRDFRAPLCGTLAGCALMFTWGLITYRYLHDMFPWLVMGSAIAVAGLPAIPRRTVRYGLAGFFVAATLYALCVNFAFAVRWQRYASYPIRPEKRAAFTDLCTIVDTAGLKGFLWYARHWHQYIPAASFQGGNVVVDNVQLAERGDQPVIRSLGQPPYGAQYAVDLPAAGTYEIAIRYASGEPRPLHLFVNGNDVKEVCAAPTGGWLASDRRWDSAGLFRLNAGANQIGLASYGPFPPVYMLRVMRVD